MFAALFVLLLVSFANAQQRWTMTYGGASYDVGNSARQTSDGGYIIVGGTSSYGHGFPDLDVWLIKTNASGDTLWTRTYGGTHSDFGAAVRQTSDNGYIIAGYTLSFGAGGYDVWLIKTDSSGETLWTRTFGGAVDEEGCDVQQTLDGGFIVAGYTTSFGAGGYDVYLIKTNASGDTLWTRTYGGTGADLGNSVEQTADSGYIVAGYTNSFGAGGNDVYLIKTNATGDTTWTRTCGTTADDLGYSVRQTSDRGYIVAGYTSSSGADSDDVYLVKTNASGDSLWTRTYGGTGTDWGYSVGQTSNGGYVIAGLTSSFGAGNADVYAIKTSASGDTLWTRTYGGTARDVGLSVQETSDGGCIIAGFTGSFGAGGADAYLVKMDANGSVSLEEPRSGRLMAAGSLRATPNPFTASARIAGHEAERFNLYDASGRRLGVCRGDRVGAGLRPGVYFMSPVGARPGRDVTQTIIKAGF